MFAEGRQRSASGAFSGQQPFAIDLQSNTLVSQGHAALYEPSRLGRIFTACTPVAGVAPGTALSATPPLTLYNPQQSGMQLSLLFASLGYISGALGAGSLVFGCNPTPSMAVPTGGTELVSLCELIGSPRGIGKAYQGATLAAAPVILRPVWTLGVADGTTKDIEDHVLACNGIPLIASGCSVSLQGIAAGGTTPLVLLSLTWEEVPIG
jgi:hypothetical protein